ncbi:hypothetical protein BDP55DRAFT_697110 [Colletotrichum godetiae]|uniref:Extracellular protein n=1 Tax=Colletotrichum godetiae TaxID=1209918 RepID=A0AAJ0ABT4_9PEZI|nr:uncharacterized protein BDP55DRAFT_697110 [Colletotrichum godetiae]KAK1670969.1 hypothetical protein BDP55DRAFT_697110 [Colletotrichum godetiae]
MAGKGCAHMATTDPPPIKAKGDPHTLPENNAGGSYSVTISGHAVCSVSVDGHSSFKVIRSFIGGCPSDDATQLASRPPDEMSSADQAILAWTWFNNFGNREMYLNCSVIRFQSKPGDLQANVGNGCKTVDSRDVMIPNPGPDVEVSNSDAVPPIGDCEFGPGAIAGSGSGSGSDNGGNGGSDDGRGRIHEPGNDWPADFNPDSGKVVADEQIPVRYTENRSVSANGADSQVGKEKENIQAEHD